MVSEQSQAAMESIRSRRRPKPSRATALCRGSSSTTLLGHDTQSESFILVAVRTYERFHRKRARRLQRETIDPQHTENNDDSAPSAFGRHRTRDRLTLVRPTQLGPVPSVRSIGTSHTSGQIVRRDGCVGRPLLRRLMLSFATCRRPEGEWTASSARRRR